MPRTITARIDLTSKRPAFRDPPPLSERPVYPTKPDPEEQRRNRIEDSRADYRNLRMEG